MNAGKPRLGQLQLEGKPVLQTFQILKDSDVTGPFDETHPKGCLDFEGDGGSKKGLMRNHAEFSRIQHAKTSLVLRLIHNCLFFFQLDEYKCI